MSAVLGVSESRSAGGAASRLLPDAQLARLASRGSEAAFAEIFRRYHQPLYRYASSLLANEQDARDAVQATMVKLLDSLPGERRKIALKPWLYRIAHNEAISIIRRRRETSLAEEADLPARQDDTELRMRMRALLADLNRLPPRQRSAVVMRELSGLSHAEIGFALGTSEAAAKQAVYEGRLALQQAEAGREMDCAAAREAISARDRRILRGRRIRAHLRSCSDCRAFAEAIRGRRAGFAALAPMPLAVSKQMLDAIVGSGAGPAGGLGTLGAAGTAKALGGGAAAQLAAGVVVAAGAGVAVSSGVAGKGGAAGDPVRRVTPAAAVTAATATGAGHRPSAVPGGSRGRRQEAGGKRKPSGRRRHGDGKRSAAPDSHAGEGSGDAAAGRGRPDSPPGLGTAAAHKPDSAGNSEGHSQGVPPPGLGSEPGTPATPPAPPKPETPPVPSKPDPPKPPSPEPPVPQPPAPPHGGGPP